MRILHAARNIANQPGYVVRALRRLGHEAEVWEYGESPFGFAVDRTIPLPEDKDPRVFWDTMLEAIERFDVLHFHFGRSLFPSQWRGVPAFWDLPIYRALGKKVFFTFHGSDCRIRRIHEQVNPWSYYATSDIEADDDRTEKVIEVVRTYANRMFVVSVDYLHFIPEAEVVPRVIDLDEWPERPPQQRAEPVILHVPSRRETKGTDRILAAVETLRGGGLPFEFRLLEKVSHDEARAAIGEADIVIDNVVTGDYEVVSMEAMASSRVAVAHVADDARAAFPDAPVFSLDPDTLVDRLRLLIGDLELRRRLASEGRAYVARVHDAPVIATTLLDHYGREARPVPARVFPDWLSIEGARKIERLDTRVAKLEQQLAAAQVREERLRAGLGLGRGWSFDPKSLLPDPLRVRLRRLRARLAGPRR